ncbi:MAG: LptA/OstA family protein, partial [Methylocella sp.]
MRKLAILSAALICVMAAQGLAQDATKATAAGTAAKSEDPIEIESDRMEVKDEENISIFTGKVIATRPDMTLNAEKLVVHYTDAKQADG